MKSYLEYEKEFYLTERIEANVRYDIMSFDNTVYQINAKDIRGDQTVIIAQNNNEIFFIKWDECIINSKTYAAVVKYREYDSFREARYNLFIQVGKTLFNGSDSSIFIGGDINERSPGKYSKEELIRIHEIATDIRAKLKHWLDDKYCVID